MTRFVPSIILTCLLALPCTQTSTEAQEKPAAAAQDTSLTERLPPKIHQIQKELPVWMQKSDNKDKAAEAAALMQKMQEQLKARNLDEVEKTADSILKMMGVNAAAGAQGDEPKPQQTPPSSPPSDDPTVRLTEKIGRVKEGLQTWVASGRNPSAIVKTMQETIKPLLDGGKAIEAEAELDRVLEQLKPEAKAPGSSEPVRDRSLGNKVRTEAADHFCVWISKTDGSERKLILSDPKRQMSHTRVSPDLKWVVFTTYNNPGADGFAKEAGNYANTEIGLFKLGGTELKTIAGPVPGEVNANATFSSDGKRIIFVSTRSGKGAFLYWYDLETGLTSQVPTPPSLHRLSDPHEVGNKIIFPSQPEQSGLQGIWMMNRDGSEARQISFPKKNADVPAENPAQGDYDPRLSPDGSRVTIFRNVGGAFHTVLLDIASGKETDLTEPLFPERKLTAEGVAAWSSDGQWLVFRHIAVPKEWTAPRMTGAAKGLIESRLERFGAEVL